MVECVWIFLQFLVAEQLYTHFCVYVCVCVYVCMSVLRFLRRRTRSYDFATPVLLTLLVCWRNSTQFFGMYAYRTKKIGDFS